MGHFFTDFFRQQLFANQDLMNTASFRLCFFRQAPSLASGAQQWAQYKTKAELHALPAWQELDPITGYPLIATMAVSKREIGVNNYIMFNTPYSFVGLSQAVPVAAIGVEFIGTLAGTAFPLIFVTDTPTAGGTNIAPGDALTANPDTVNIPDNSNRYLFSWADPPAGAPNYQSLVPGPDVLTLTILRAAPLFEPSNTLHVWLYPQRANMIANPSFELDANYWAPAPTRVAGGAPNGGAWAGKFAASAVESNIWSTRMGDEYAELWTFQLMAKGTGKVRVGLISWDADYRGTQCDWGPDEETWELQAGAWIHIACVREGPQAHTAMLRIECDGSDITIDKVLAERGALKEWSYFDGDETYALQDAHSWYGGYRGASYSMWYGARRSVMGRLFATPTDTDAPGDVITDADVLAAGMVYNWVPAGVTVIPHIDVFYPNDLRSPPPTRSTAVLPYDNGSNGGVVNPWV